jgi:hypothetical protein
VAGRPRGIGPRPPIPGGGGIGRPVCERRGAGGGGIGLPVGLRSGRVGASDPDEPAPLSGAAGAEVGDATTSEGADGAAAAGTDGRGAPCGGDGVTAAGRGGADEGTGGRLAGAGRDAAGAGRSCCTRASCESSLAGRLRTTRCSGRSPSAGRSAPSAPSSEKGDGASVTTAGGAGRAVVFVAGLVAAFGAGVGSSGWMARTSPSRSALRRTRSAWASSIDEEWLLTPIPSPIERSSASLFVSPSSFASS